MIKLQIVYLGVFMGLISCMSMNSKYPFFDVDDMLRRVIQSEKFEEIAEKIADKAVERLSALKNSDSLIKIREGALSYPVSRVSETSNKENQTEKQIEVSTPAAAAVENKSEETTKRTIELLSDTTAFKKKSTKSSKDLSLKFKRFTRLNYLKDDTKENTNKDDETVTKQSQESGLESNATRTTKEDNKIERTKSKPEKFRHKEKERDKEKDKEKEKEIEAENSESSDENSTEKTTKATKEDSSQAESVEADSLNKDYEADRKLQLSEVSEKVSDHRPSELFKLRAPKDSVESNSTENEGVWESEEHVKRTKERKNRKTKQPWSKDKKSKKKEKKSTTLKDFIRREGNKLYTYEKSPDYAEYHEEIARIQKKMDKDDDTKIFV